MAAFAFAPPPRDLYEKGIDFDALALQDVDFANIYYAADDKVDFRDPKAVQQLTKSLLKRDFGLRLSLPDDRLCPPIFDSQGRYSYVTWIQDLLDTTGPKQDDEYDPARKILGLDIGVGSSCIYPLLTTAARTNYEMFGTDIDDQNLSYAQANVDANNLSSRIHIRRSTSDSPLIPFKALGVDHLDFTMCNPPFYFSKEDLDASEQQKGAPPSAVCTGAEVEMICDGGDVGFVLQMVEESLKLGTSVQWYTSMFGKLSSVYKILDRLKEVGINNWAVCCLKAGNKTRRWALGWSFTDYRPRYDVARSGDLPAALHPLHTAQTIHTPNVSLEESAKRLNSTLSSLNLFWEWNVETLTGRGSATENVWSRAARRKQKRLQIDATTGKTVSPSDLPGMARSAKDDVPTSNFDQVAMAFKITLTEGASEVRWSKGRDFVIFESFCGMLKRGIQSNSVDVVA